MVSVGARQAATGQMDPIKLSIPISAKRLQRQTQKSTTDFFGSRWIFRFRNPTIRLPPDV